MRRDTLKHRMQIRPGERALLERWAQAPKTPQALAQRARMVLACAEGDTNVSVAAAVGVTPQTVGKWRRRFEEKRLSGLADAPRTGAPRTLPRGSAEWVLMLTLLELI